MTTKISWSAKKVICLLSLFIAIGSLYGSLGFAEQQTIRARYLHPRGTDIKWKIYIPSPPPAAVIVIQSIPPGTVIEKSSPQLESYDPETGTAKWLLTEVQPGKITMRMELNQPIRKKGEIHGEIIFQDQENTPIASVFMSPKKKTKAIEGC